MGGNNTWKQKQSLDISESRLVKSGIVADLVRGKNIGEAFAILKFTPKVGADVVEKLCVLQSQTLNITSI